MRRETVPMTVPGAVETGTPVPMERFGANARAEIDSGSWAATIKIQERMGDGEWRTIGANFTGGTGGVCEIPDSATHVRAQVTVYTSGAVTARVSGIDTTKN